MSNAARTPPPEPPDSSNEEKAAAMISLLYAHNVVRVVVALYSDVAGPGLVLPREVIAANLSKGSTALDVGLRMAVPIPDLQVDELGIRGTLSFSRVPFHVSIPWRFVIGIQLLDAEGKPGKPPEPGKKKRWLVDVTADIPFDPKYQDFARVPETVAPPTLRSVPKAPAARPEADEPAPLREHGPEIDPESGGFPS